MTESKLINDIIFDNLNQRIKNIGEKCLNYQEENKRLKKQLARKTQECEGLKKERDFYSAEYTRVSTQLMSQDAYILIDGKEVWSGDNRKLKQQLDKLKAAIKQTEQKLEKIKDRCNETLELMNKDSGTNAYAGGRCIEAENILKIIDEVK